MSGNTPVWYALQVFHRKGDTLLLHLERNGVKCFFPICYAEHAGTSGKSRRSLLPATHDQLFVQYGQGKGPILAETLQASPYASRVYTKTDGCWCDIGSAEMAELRAASDPGFQGTLFVEAGFAATRRGTPVCVVRGPLKGLKGKLVRYRKRSYVVLIAASIGILVHVPKWYCHPLKADTGIPHQQEKKPETSHAEKTPPNATRCVTMRAVNTPHQKKGEA